MIDLGTEDIIETIHEEVNAKRNVNINPTPNYAEDEQPVGLMAKKIDGKKAKHVKRNYIKKKIKNNATVAHEENPTNQVLIIFLHIICFFNIYFNFFINLFNLQEHHNNNTKDVNVEKENNSCTDICTVSAK